VSHPYFTIGHSTRSLDEFVAMLRENGVNLVADVRTVARSRTNPQFNRDRLPQTLAAEAIEYRHLPKLGGLRGKPKGQQASPNSFWTNDSFRNYADYALTEPFQEGFSQLRSLHGQHVCAIMCAEAVWWRCHRRIITDYLIASGETVCHIMAPHRTEHATMTPAARVQPDGALVYAAEPGR
jgi:uncharacterized protein (DUF488 family)